jgi:hypothetical protein
LESPSSDTTCACGQDVDVLGVHTQKCRLDGNLTNSTHNRLVACLAEMIRSYGQSVRVEVTGIFNNVDPTSNQRMDLFAYDPGRPKQLYDVVVTNPVTAAVLQSNTSNLRAAWTQQRTKEKRYRVAATEAGMITTTTTTVTTTTTTTTTTTVCLLPTILFIDIGKCRRADLDAKVELILGNRWSFKVGDFPGRMEKKVPVKDNRSQLAGAAPSSEQVIGSIEDLDKRRMAYFKKLMTKGEVSKAYRAIVSDAKVLPYSLDGLQFLPSKNPAASPGEAPWNRDEEYIGAEDPILITFEGVVKVIRSAPKGASCGVDNFPVDILKQLTKTVTKKEFPTDTRLFLDLLIGFLNIVFTHGQCPPGVLSFYDAGEAIRLRQGATKVRPIGKATTHRKVVDVAQQLPHRQDLQTAFGDI